jgi:hypothetical protein
MKIKVQKSIGITLIIIGAICFILIGSLSIWADLEATLFNSAMRSDKRLTSLKCPSFITEEEIGIISATFHNSSDKPISPLIRTYVTDGYVILMREKVDRLDIAPGETASVEVEVTADNAVYNRLVLARMHQFAYGPLSYRNASCGIYVLNIKTITGNQFIAITATLGLFLSAIGVWLWVKHSRPIIWDQLTKFHQILAFVLISMLISIVGLLSWWLLGVLLFVFWVLLVVGLISQAILSSKKISNQEDK